MGEVREGESGGLLGYQPGNWGPTGARATQASGGRGGGGASSGSRENENRRGRDEADTAKKSTEEMKKDRE